MLTGDNSVEMALNKTSTGIEDDLGPYPDMSLENSDDGYFSTIIGAVIAVVILVLVSLLAVILHYMYRHKGTYHTNEAKGTEFTESADAALRGDPTLGDAMNEDKKEYFI